MADKAHINEPVSALASRGPQRRPDRKGIDRPERYVVTVRGAVPTDLMHRVSNLHAVAIIQGGGSPKTPHREPDS